MSRTYDPFDPSQAEQRQESATLAHKQAQYDWQFVLGTPQGRRVMAALLVQCGFLDGSYRPGDALGTAHAEGKRAVAIMIYSAATSAGQAGLAEALLAEATRKPNAV